MKDENPHHYRYWVVYITKGDDKNFGIGSHQFETDKPIIHLTDLIAAVKPALIEVAGGDFPFTFLNWQLVALRHKNEDWRPTHPLAKT